MIYDAIDGARAGIAAIAAFIIALAWRAAAIAFAPRHWTVSGEPGDTDAYTWYARPDGSRYCASLYRGAYGYSVYTPGAYDAAIPLRAGRGAWRTMRETDLAARRLGHRPAYLAS